MTISESLYTHGIQCQKELWLKNYKPQVLTLLNTVALVVFATGDIVSGLACELFLVTI